LVYALYGLTPEEIQIDRRGRRGQTIVFLISTANNCKSVIHMVSPSTQIEKGSSGIGISTNWRGKTVEFLRGL